MIILPQYTVFEWDSGNQEKNWIKHKVSNTECEEMFFSQPLFILEDPKHSQQEERFYALGKTNNNRFLFISFTLRDNRIRIISARSMNKKERKYYETAT